MIKKLAMITSLVSMLAVTFSSAQANTDFTYADKKSSYKLRPLDVVNVRIFQEPDLDTIYKVGNNGMIVLPLIGSVRVEGLTLQDAQKRVKELYEKDYLVNAEVSMYISEYSQQRVYVIGQVGRPGEVIFPPEETMTLAKAIAGAMGTTRLANTRSVNVKRKMPDGTIKVFDVDLKAILNDNTAKDFPVYDGDTIEVQESIF